MISKIRGTKNGYHLMPDSTKEDFKGIIAERLSKRRSSIRCIICNWSTSKRFGTPLTGSNIITINNKVGDGEIYINSVN